MLCGTPGALPKCLFASRACLRPCIRSVFFPVGHFRASWSNVNTSPPAFKILVRAPSVNRNAQIWSNSLKWVILKNTTEKQQQGNQNTFTIALNTWLKIRETSLRGAGWSWLPLLWLLVSTKTWELTCIIWFIFRVLMLKIWLRHGFSPW